MTHRQLQVYFFLAVFAASVILLFLVFRPLLPLLIFAGILALLMRPVFQWLVKYFRGLRGLAAFSTIVLTLLIVLAPLTFIGISLAVEAVQFFNRLRAETNIEQLEGSLAMLIGPEQAALFSQRVNEALADVAGFLQPFVTSLTSNIFTLFSNTAAFVLGTVIVLFAMYYILKDGPALKKELLDLSPLEDKDDEKVFKRVNDAVIAVAYGEFVVSIIKGLIGGITFLALGLPSPVFWGTVIALSNLIPGVGTALVTVPFAAWLFLSGQYATGVIFTAIAFLVISLVDNFLMPHLIRGRMEIHPLLILFSLLGGLLVFGPVGIFFGPVILSVTLGLVDIYKTEFRDKVERL